MNTALFYGFVLALVNVVLLLVGFFLGYQTDKFAQGQWFGALYLVAAIVVLWLGIRAAREDAPGKALTYGRGVKVGFLISLYSGIIEAIYAFIHFGYINTAYAEYYLDFAKQRWAAHGMGAAQMASAEKGTRLMLTPGMMSVLALFQALFYGIIITLILSALLRRPPPKPNGEPPPLG